MLCGHSAGAHLCASLLCDPRVLAEEGVADASSFLMGFVGISGVFNLERLGRFPIGSALLEPVFGNLQSASPVHLVAQASAQDRLLIETLPLLLLTAEVRLGMRASEETCYQVSSVA